MQLSWLQPFGFFTSLQLNEQKDPIFPSRLDEATVNTISKIAGYTPGISIVVGLVRLIFITYYGITEVSNHGCADQPAELLLFLSGHTARAFLEMSCVAVPLLILIDVIITIVETVLIQKQHLPIQNNS